MRQWGRTLAGALDPVTDADGLAVGELCPVPGADALVGVVLEVRHGDLTLESWVLAGMADDKWLVVELGASMERRLKSNRTILVFIFSCRDGAINNAPRVWFFPTSPSRETDDTSSRGAEYPTSTYVTSRQFRAQQRTSMVNAN